MATQPPVTARLTPGARKLFQGKNFAHLATLMPDGSPQVTPVWVDVEGDNIIVSSAIGRQRTGNVRRDPRVAVSVHNQENPYQSAFVRGRVVAMREDASADALIDKLAKKYLGQDRYPWRQPGERRVTLVIKPEHVSGMGTE